MNRYWVRNSDLKKDRVRDNPKEVVLVTDYDALLADRDRWKARAEAGEAARREWRHGLLRQHGYWVRVQEQTKNAMDLIDGLLKELQKHEKGGGE